MTIIHDGFPATRRVILKGAGAVALVGLGNIPFSLVSGVRRGQRQISGRCVQSEERSGRDQIALWQDRRAIRQGQARRTGNRRERRGGSDLGQHHPSPM